MPNSDQTSQCNMPHQGQGNLDTFMIVLLSPNDKQRERERERVLEFVSSGTSKNTARGL